MNVKRLAPAAGPTVQRLAPALAAVLGVGLLAAMLWRLPHIGGTTWSGILGILTGVGAGTLGVLAVVWLAAMVGHTIVQVAALPELGHRRALMLNLATSAVASGLPGGGPLSVAANWAMLRSWGFSAAAFSTYTLVTTTVVAAGKLVLPVLAGGAVVAAGGTLTGSLRTGLIIAAAAAGVVALAVVAIAALPGRPSGPPRHGPAIVSRAVEATRALLLRAATAVRSAWRQLLTGTVMQLGLQYVLFLLCLRATGVRLDVVSVLAAFAVGRILSALPLTPGGMGVTETGTSALLVALGADPASAIAGTLLFSLFVVVLEIPLGAVGLLWWRLSVRSRDRLALAA